MLLGNGLSFFCSLILNPWSCLRSLDRCLCWCLCVCLCFSAPPPTTNNDQICPHQSTHIFADRHPRASHRIDPHHFVGAPTKPLRSYGSRGSMGPTYPYPPDQLYSIPGIHHSYVVQIHSSHSMKYSVCTNMVLYCGFYRIDKTCIALCVYSMLYVHLCV